MIGDIFTPLPEIIIPAGGAAIPEIIDEKIEEEVEHIKMTAVSMENIWNVVP